MYPLKQLKQLAKVQGKKIHIFIHDCIINLLFHGSVGRAFTHRLTGQGFKPSSCQFVLLATLSLHPRMLPIYHLVYVDGLTIVVCD